MRKVSQESAMAFAMNYSIKKSNTKVEFVKHSNYVYFFLHNNLIAVKDNNSRKLRITNAGWFTPTTKERLNGILYYCSTNAHISQKNFQWFITQGEEVKKWDGAWLEIA